MEFMDEKPYKKVSIKSKNENKMCRFDMYNII